MDPVGYSQVLWVAVRLHFDLEEADSHLDYPRADNRASFVRLVQ